MDALSGLAWIGGITDHAMLPFLIIHKLALELEGVVDVAEPELDILSL